MAEPTKKIDPVGEQYFEPLRVAELIVDILFYVSAAFSILALFADRTSRPVLYSVVQIGFALSVVALFVGSLAIRLYFSPRAQKRRYEDFLAHAFATPLSHQQTTRYYNNSAKTVPLRISAQVLENCLYTKSTASRMVTMERIKIVVYVVIWILIALIRSIDLGIVGVAAQIVFSEQILSRWLRLEWIRLKCESVFDDLFQVIKSGADLELQAVRLLGEYEIAKAIAGITLSTRLFERNQGRVDREWAQIRTTLGI
jgi:hypothetical protein